MWFAALGGYDQNPWFVAFMQRLLQGSPEVAALLRRNPFPDHPPRYVRAVRYLPLHRRRRARYERWGKHCSIFAASALSRFTGALRATERLDTDHDGVESRLSDRRRRCGRRRARAAPVVRRAALRKETGYCDRVGCRSPISSRRVATRSSGARASGGAVAAALHLPPEIFRMTRWRRPLAEPAPARPAAAQSGHCSGRPRDTGRSKRSRISAASGLSA
jgi:hypothetical protein